MKPLTVHSDYHPEALRRFNSDTADHEMEILLDQGLYRHIRFKKPGTGFYYFDLITWPGNLTIRADMGTYTFARTEDMFEFFTNGHGYINAGYWGEKLQAAGTHAGYRDHNEDLFKKYVIEHFWKRREGYSAEDAKEIWETIRSEVLNDYEYMGSREACMGLVQNFRINGYEFIDPWDCSWEDYTFHYLWCCHAILSGIRHYYEAKAAADGEAAG
ncbi:hypothetical protein [Arthrobacter sp. EpRS71]|uniref:hypothetical protein n=1 Tax=Arthrobacter sp. EpRS71 TaxID=1743141 RepID=UPI00074730C3|nr:hypothetical protein [Arthrobacter sp. EpRS71]KUM34567.1 hypothetical protein AR689_10525 [Arthrobacter sp. EpRS71]